MNPKKYMMDILQYAEEIDFHLARIKNFEDYSNDLTVKRAIERCFEIIGKAMNQLLSFDPRLNISGKKQIIALRNRIIHGYDSVSDQVIWTITHDNLPVLKSEIIKLLEG